MDDNLNPHPQQSEFITASAQEPPTFSPASALDSQVNLAIAELGALKDQVARNLQLVVQNIQLGDQRNDKLAKAQEVLLTQATNLFSEMRDTMELMQATIGQADQQVQQLTAVVAGLVTLDASYRDMVAQWQLEHQH